MSKLTQYCQRATVATNKAAKLFFDISCQVRPYPVEIIEIAMDKLINLLLHQERSMKIEYINLCYDRLENGESSMQCVRLMQKILDQIPRDKMGSLISGMEIA